MSKRDSIKKGSFLIGGGGSDCRGYVVPERPAPRPSPAKNLAAEKMAEIERQHGAAIAEIKRRLDAVKAGLEAMTKAKRK